jgi:hypothetical protein
MSSLAAHATTTQRARGISSKTWPSSRLPNLREKGRRLSMAVEALENGRRGCKASSPAMFIPKRASLFLHNVVSSECVQMTSRKYRIDCAGS